MQLLPGNRRNWKAHILDYAAYQEMSDNVHCVALTQRQIGIIIGALTPLYWRTRWKNAHAVDIQSEIADIERALSGACEDGESILQFRQSPDDDCILQYSTDNGTTWFDAFNYALCRPDGTPDIINIENEFNAVFNQYDGTNISITVNLSTASQLDIDAAMCAASRAWIDTAIASLKRAKSDAETRAAIAGLAFGAVSGAAFWLAGPIAGAVAGGLAGAVLSVAVDGLINIPDSVFDDTITREQIVCCMMDALRGAVPDETSWSQSLDNCNLSGDAASLADVVSATMTAETYVGWLQSLDTAIPFVASGRVVDDCICVEEAWNYKWDFTVSDGGWTADYPTRSGLGTWVAGVGWKPSENAGRRGVYIRLAGAWDGNGTIEQCKMFGDGQSSSGECSFQAGTLPAGDSDDHNIQIAVDALGDAIMPVGAIAWTGRPGDIAFVQPGDGDWTVTRISVNGTGPRPPFTGGEWVS